MRNNYYINVTNIKPNNKHYMMIKYDKQLYIYTLYSTIYMCVYVYIHTYTHTHTYVYTHCASLRVYVNKPGVLLRRPIPLSPVLEPVADLGQGETGLLREGSLVFGGRVTVSFVAVLQGLSRFLLHNYVIVLQ